MAQRAADRLVWIDCEMTGLDLTRDALVEVAVIVTESDLTEIDAGMDVVIHATPEQLESMPDVVREMHTASGLLEDIPSGVSLADAEAMVMEYVRGHVPDQRKAPLAGSSVYVDRGFIARDMKALDEHLHYRVVDVSSIKEVVRRWYPRVYYNSPTKHGNHRALADIRESIAELRYYREAVFVAEPGPNTDDARAMADSHVVPPATSTE